jgi:hypothetical protein
MSAHVATSQEKAYIRSWVHLAPPIVRVEARFSSPEQPKISGFLALLGAVVVLGILGTGAYVVLRYLI